MSTRPIYLDNCATTRVDPGVLETMLPFFGIDYGNAASHSHVYGWTAQEAVDNAREQIAALIGAAADEIVLTSGSTESNNLAIKGVAHGGRHDRGHIITCATEHKSVLDTCDRLKRRGVSVSVLPVGRQGRLSLEQVEEAITDSTVLVSLMLVNNETGVVQPISEVAALCRRRGILLHTDATQATGKLPVDVNALGVDLLSFSAHKMYGPKGVGALYIRQRTPRIELEPLIDGGGHQSGLRSGTLAVPLIVGFGAACARICADLPAEVRRLRRLRDRLEQGIASRIADVRINGNAAERSPAVSNMSFPGVDGEELLVALDGLAVSSGSACTSASGRPSYVLTAMGVSDVLARSTLRLSVGRFNTNDEIDDAIDIIATVVDDLLNAGKAETFREALA